MIIQCTAAMLLSGGGGGAGEQTNRQIFLEIYYHNKMCDPTRSGASITPRSEVCTVVMLILLMAVNYKSLVA
jgi:hypothetical protein